MKTLFIGGIKSGKSRLAESYILERATGKPYYLATNEVFDDEMKARVQVHQQRRQDAFITVEEPVELLAALRQCPGPALVECVSMWLNNQLYYQVPETEILQELEAVLQLSLDLVLVHNEVGLSVVSDNRLARQFVDLSGKAAQMMGQHCDRVYFCSAGLTMKMK